VTPAPGPAAADPPPGADRPASGDGGRWREAARLRHEHGGWAIIWLAPSAEFRAYRRLPGERRDTALSAPTAEALAEKITQAEQTAARTPAHGSGHD
jgi:hypothetical protein